MGEGKSERINDKRIDDCINGKKPASTGKGSWFGGATPKCGDVYLGGAHSQAKYGLGAAKLPNDGVSEGEIEAMFGN